MAIHIIARVRPRAPSQLQLTHSTAPARRCSELRAFVNSLKNLACGDEVMRVFWGRSCHVYGWRRPPFLPTTPPRTPNANMVPLNNPPPLLSLSLSLSGLQRWRRPRRVGGISDFADPRPECEAAGVGLLSPLSASVLAAAWCRGSQPTTRFASVPCALPSPALKGPAHFKPRTASRARPRSSSPSFCLCHVFRPGQYMR